MKNWIVYILALMIVSSGCYKEEKIHGREGGEPFYVLPQGNHPYDQTIVEWFENCGFYILYIFDEKDLYWDNTDWKEAESTHMLGQKGKSGNPDFVGMQLEMIDEVFLSNYSIEMLEKYMPLKLLLCAELYDTKIHSFLDEETEQYEHEVIYFDILTEDGYDYIAVNGGNDKINTFSDSMKTEYSMELNSWFLRKYADKEVRNLYPQIPISFFEVSLYNENNISREQLPEYGYLDLYVTSSDRTKEQRQQADVLAYLKLVGYPLSILEEMPPTDLGDDWSCPSLRGVLHPDRDVNGLVRQKYEIMVEFVKSLGIDTDKLQYPTGKN